MGDEVEERNCPAVPFVTLDLEHLNARFELHSADLGRRLHYIEPDGGNMIMRALKKASKKATQAAKNVARKVKKATTKAPKPTKAPAQAPTAPQSPAVPNGETGTSLSNPTNPGAPTTV